MAGFCVLSCALFMSPATWFVAVVRGTSFPQQTVAREREIARRCMVRTTVTMAVVRRACGAVVRSEVQQARCAGQQQRRAARPERLEEQGQYGWWPALDGERYRAWLHKFSVRADPRSARAGMPCEIAHDNTLHSLIGEPRDASPCRFRSRPQSLPRGTSS